MPLDGLQLGRYRLLHLLGAGGMGEVYLAEDTPIMRQVAIKVIKSYGMPYPGAMTTDDVNRLFLREARAIAALQHPYILSLFDYGDVAVEGGMLSYMVMPYCQEGSLEAWLLRRGSSHLPSLHLIALILEQAADALQYAHEKQIIHQDVKLSNFLIHRWRALSIPDLLLADFGIAKFLSTHSRTSQSIRGTPTSMAPEQWDGHPVPATDQYALAVMIYQLLTGYPPFQGGPGQVMYQHLTVSPKPPSTWQPGIPPAIDMVILKALMKQPQDRFESLLAFAQAFRQALPPVSDLEAMHVQGDDLAVTLALSREEAVSGANRTLTLPDGRYIRLSIPPGVQTGQTLLLKALSDQFDTDVSVQTVAVTIVITHPEHQPIPPLVPDEETILRTSPAVSSIKRDTPFPPVNKTMDSKPPAIVSNFPPTISSAEPPTFIAERSASEKQQISHHRQGFVSGKGLIMALLVLVLIAGSAGITFYLARTSPPTTPTKSAPATTQATTVNTATTATAIATVSPQTPTMTTTQPAAVSNPYPPYSGTLALNDPLSDNTRGYSWEEGTRDQGTCTFASGTYQSDIPLAGYFHSCLALSTDFSNCAYEVQMTLVSGSAGGIVFRADRATTHLYYFTVDRNGGYLLKAYYDKVGHSSVIARGSGISFHETELIGVVAQGSTISLYVNRQLIQQVQDGTFMQGQVGVVVYQGEAIFGSAKVWAL